MVGESKPLVITDKHGRILDVSQMNPKSFYKSTEQGSLWYVHPETERVLPFGDGVAFIKLIERQGWYEAIIPATDEPPGATPEIDTQPETVVSRSAPSIAQSEWGVVLRDLVDIIKDRKRTLPEGSYTSYLFNSGIEKIRKKTGEEAIELLLAGNESDVVYEAADLIYHMLVLLEELGIPFAKLIDELAKRRGTGTQN